MFHCTSRFLIAVFHSCFSVFAAVLILFFVAPHSWESASAGRMMNTLLRYCYVAEKSKLTYVFEKVGQRLLGLRISFFVENICVWKIEKILKGCWGQQKRKVAGVKIGLTMSPILQSLHVNPRMQRE